MLDVWDKPVNHDGSNSGIRQKYVSRDALICTSSQSFSNREEEGFVGLSDNGNAIKPRSDSRHSHRVTAATAALRIPDEVQVLKTKHCVPSFEGPAGPAGPDGLDGPATTSYGAKLTQRSLKTFTKSTFLPPNLCNLANAYRKRVFRRPAALQHT